MTDNARKVISYLQEAGAGVKFTVKEVQTALGFERSEAVAIAGTITSLAKKKEAEWITETDANGEEKKYLALTQAGMEIDTNA